MRATAQSRAAFRNTRVDDFVAAHLPQVGIGAEQNDGRDRLAARELLEQFFRRRLPASETLQHIRDDVRCKIAGHALERRVLFLEEAVHVGGDLILVAENHVVVLIDGLSAFGCP